MGNSIKDRIRFLLKHIDTVLSDTKGKTLEQFAESDLLVRATCFSIVQVGEQMTKLEKHLADKYPDLPWDEARDMRILIVHIYNKVDAAQIYKTAMNDLPELKEKIMAISDEMFGPIN